MMIWLKPTEAATVPPLAKDEEVSFFEKQPLGDERSLYVGVLKSHGFVIPS